MYAFSTIVNYSYNEAIEKVTAALKEEGFGVLTEIDVAATMKKKLGIEKSPYIILGACNPTLANKAIDAEPNIGLLLPCNVVVRVDEKEQVVVAFMDPESVLSLVDMDGIQPLASDVKSRLERVKNAL